MAAKPTIKPCRICGHPKGLFQVPQRVGRFIEWVRVCGECKECNQK